MINKLSKLGGWWRLLVVLLMVCTLASTLMVTSTATPVLAAHSINVTIDPTTIDMGSTQCHTMNVKNNGPASIKKVEVNLPAEFNGSFSLTDVTTPSGWVLVTNTARTKLWQTTSTSAYIARNGIKSFGFCLIAPDCEPGDFYCLAVKTTDTYNVIANGCANIEVTNCAPQFEPEELGCVASGDTVTICSQIVDSSLDPLTTYLYYSTDLGGNWSSALMELDCLTGLFCTDVTIPSLPDCSEVWYYMNASDCAGLTGWYPIDAEIDPTLDIGHVTLLVMSGTGPTINEFTNTSPIDGCLAGGSTVSVSWNVSSLCCPVEDMMVQIEFVSTISESYDTTICLATQLSSEDVDGYAIGSATVTLPMVNLNNSSLQLVARDCCGFCNYSDPDIDLTCIESELAMFDAITGWHWVWGGEGHPGNYNDRYSIMVIFNKELDPTTVSASDFQVTNPTATVTSIELHNNVYPGNANGNFSVVFLNLNTPLATNALPTVKLAGSVSNIVVGGDVCDPEAAEEATGTQVICEDGIAPVLTLTTTPTNPAYGQVVSVSLTSTEPIPACCSFCSCCPNYPSVWVESEGDDVQVYMTPNPAGTVWTGTFVNMVRPDSEWRLEAEACTCLNYCDLKPWKEPKCAEASLIFDGFDVQFIEVCEGWNLISVADTLAEPSISKAFSRYMSEVHYGPVTKVYYFTGGTSGQWQCSVLNPVTGLWTGPVTQIDPGKAYWVWCDDGGIDLAMRLAPRSPVASMPSIPVKAGWNLVGIWDINHGTGGVEAWAYFASILKGATGGYPTAWTWLNCYEEEWVNMIPSELLTDIIPYGTGFWLSVNQDGVIYPVIYNP